MNRYVAFGVTALAGAALFEAALIPGMVIGAAAVLAPQVLPRLLRRPRAAPNSTARRRTELLASATRRPEATARPITLGNLEVGRALAKTVTFRIIVTTIDFTANYVIIGELVTAAGLSAFSLAAGPFFYFLHEVLWNYYGPAGPTLHAALPPHDLDAPVDDEKGLTMSRPLAKTITFRFFATLSDFGTNLAFVGDLATATALTAVGFVIGPFVYFGHEKAWDHFWPESERAPDPPPMKLLPAPA